MVNPQPDRRYLLYERDEDGVPYAVEVVEARAWSAAYLDPPDPEDADVRLVRLRRGEAPEDVPPWLAVERSSGGISDLVATYDAGTITPGLLAAWRMCPTRRRPHAPLAEFLEALVEAAVFPIEPPADEGRQRAVLDRAAGRYEQFARLGELSSDALERWLAVRFGSPEAAVDGLLLARVEERDRSWASRLRFLREAVVPDASALAFDRTLLLEQASPRRALAEGLPLNVLASIDEWARRYRFEYDQRYARVQREVVSALAAVEVARPTVETLARLNRLGSLGPPEGMVSTDALETAADSLRAMPALPSTDATTAGITLRGSHPALPTLRSALAAIERTTRARLRRLAQALSSRILADEGITELERVLRAMQASETAELASVFDDVLLDRLDAVLSTDETSPLVLVADDYPVVTSADLEAVVSTFRSHLGEAVTGSVDGRVRLRASARLER